MVVSSGSESARVGRARMRLLLLALLAIMSQIAWAVAGPRLLPYVEPSIQGLGAWVAPLFVRTTIKVNSLHRQGIKDLGTGLRVAARDADGLVQAVEADVHGPCLVGVQWHPEYLPQPPHPRLFSALVHAAATRRK